MIEDNKTKYSLGLSISDTASDDYSLTITTDKMSDILDIKRMFEMILKDKYCVCMDNMSEIQVQYVKNEDTNGTVLVYEKSEENQ